MVLSPLDKDDFGFCAWKFKTGAASDVQNSSTRHKMLCRLCLIPNLWKFCPLVVDAQLQLTKQAGWAVDPLIASPKTRSDFFSDEASSEYQKEAKSFNFLNLNRPGEERTKRGSFPTERNERMRNGSVLFSIQNSKIEKKKQSPIPICTPTKP